MNCDESGHRHQARADGYAFVVTGVAIVIMASLAIFSLRCAWELGGAVVG